MLIYLIFLFVLINYLFFQLRHTSKLYEVTPIT
jgi:hypothetical protein